MMVDELVDEVIRSTGTDSADVDDLHHSLTTRFYHVHLPKLSDSGVIEYHSDPKAVEPRPVIDEFEPFLERI